MTESSLEVLEMLGSTGYFQWYLIPFLAFIIYVYVIFAFWIHDMPSMKKKIAIVSGVYPVDLVLLIVFMGILNWI